MPKPLQLQQQEIFLDDPESDRMFDFGTDLSFVATPGAIETFGQETILACIRLLQQKAQEYDGIDYLQVFQFPDDVELRLWFIQDRVSGVITALLPEEH